MVPHVSFTQQFDIPELLFILFLLFFLGLVYHLRQEDKREGYPLETDPMDRSRPRVAVVGFPPMPKPKMFLRKFGEPVLAPGPRLERDITGIAVRCSDFPGSPIVPTGDPLVDGIGPASYALKEEVPDITWHGTPNILPLRKLPEHSVEGTQTSPIGIEVITRDGIRVGVVADVWINVAELFGRYLEVQTLPAFGGDRIILPVAFADHQAARPAGADQHADGDAILEGAAPRRPGHHHLPRGRPHQRLLCRRPSLQPTDGKRGAGMSEFSDIPRDITAADLPAGRNRPVARQARLAPPGPRRLLCALGDALFRRHRHMASRHDAARWGQPRRRAGGGLGGASSRWRSSLGLVSLLAWLSARATVFTLTDRRIVMCYGVALPALINVPLSHDRGLEAAARFRRAQATSRSACREGTAVLPPDLALCPALAPVSRLAHAARRAGCGRSWPSSSPRPSRPRPSVRRAGREPTGAEQPGMPAAQPSRSAPSFGEAASAAA